MIRRPSRKLRPHPHSVAGQTPRDNRSNILAQALELFAERGYDAVGVQAICEAAGVTKPTLYHYFGSKRGVLETLVRERYAPFVDELAEAAEYAGDLPRTLERVATVCFRFAEREPVLQRWLLTLWFAVPAGEAFGVAAPFNTRQRELVEAMFEHAVADHGNMRGRQRIYATIFLGVIRTRIGLALNGESALDAGVAHETVRQFSYGIYS